MSALLKLRQALRRYRYPSPLPRNLAESIAFSAVDLAPVLVAVTENTIMDNHKLTRKTGAVSTSIYQLV